MPNQRLRPALETGMGVAAGRCYLFIYWLF